MEELGDRNRTSLIDLIGPFRPPDIIRSEHVVNDGWVARAPPVTLDGERLAEHTFDRLNGYSASFWRDFRVK